MTWQNYRRSDSLKNGLRYTFGDVVEDVEQAFFRLTPPTLDSLFIRYGQKHGKIAESYARRSYNEWQSGQKRLTGLIAERLIELVPHHLSGHERFELIKKLRKKYIRRHTEYVTVTPDNWRNSVHQAINTVIAKSREFKLPDYLRYSATWLANGDAEAAQRLLHAAEEDEARLRAVYLEAEFKRIDLFVSHIKDTESVSHKINIPQGDISVTVTLPKQSLWDKAFGTNGGRRMNDNSNEIIRKESLDKAIVRPPSNNSLLNIAASDLSPDERVALRSKVLSEKLALDVSQHKADQRFVDSTRDMANTVRAVNSLEQSSKSDYEVRSSFETASGRTDIHGIFL